MNPSGIEPADVKVLVLPDPVEEKTRGGIIIPENVQDQQKYATIKATLIARGPNAFMEWGPSEEDFRPGCRVVVAQYAGRRMKGVDGLEYVILNDEDVIARLKEEEHA